MKVILKTVFIHTLLLSPAYSQTPEGYIEGMKNRPDEQKVLVLGTGHVLSQYPQNYYLVDLDSEVQPDMAADLTTSSVFPRVFQHQFDVVISEFLPPEVVSNHEVLENIQFVLKSGGRFIGPLPFSMINERDMLREDSDEDDSDEDDDEEESEFLARGIHVYSPEWWKEVVHPLPNRSYCFERFSIPGFPFVCFFSGESGYFSSFDFLSDQVTEWLASFTWGESEFLAEDEKPEVWKGNASLGGYFVIHKK